MPSTELLVDINWLQSHLTDPNIVVLDGTWVMPGSTEILPEGYIPGAQFFDIDEIASDHPTLTHMLPTPEQFQEAMEHMGINNNHHVICYDRRGVATAPRLWWTFRMFGHEKVSVLDGGLPAWITAGYPVSNTITPPKMKSQYTPGASLSGVISLPEILERLSHKPQIVDTRPRNRFLGIDPEPRPGLRSGRIPGSQSLPYLACLEGKKFSDLSELEAIVGALNFDFSRPIITSCGSGVAACGVAFILARLGTENVRVYDGSWTEWGASDAPIEI